MTARRVTFRRGRAFARLPEPSVTRGGADMCELEFQLTQAQKESLRSFFVNATRGRTEEFVFTDPDGNERRAHFAEPSLVFVGFSGGRWDASVPLRLAEEVKA